MKLHLNCSQLTDQSQSADDGAAGGRLAFLSMGRGDLNVKENSLLFSHFLSLFLGACTAPVSQANSAAAGCAKYSFSLSSCTTVQLSLAFSLFFHLLQLNWPDSIGHQLSGGGRSSRSSSGRAAYRRRLPSPLLRFLRLPPRRRRRVGYRIGKLFSNAFRQLLSYSAVVWRRLLLLLFLRLPSPFFYL